MGFTKDLEVRRVGNFNFNRFSTYTSRFVKDASLFPPLPSQPQIVVQPPYQTPNPTSAAPSHLRDEAKSPAILSVSSGSMYLTQQAGNASQNLDQELEVPDLIVTQDLEQPVQPSQDRQVPTKSCRYVPIHLTDQIRRVQISHLLNYFWTKCTNTKWAVCDNDFKELDPPIRTISLQQTEFLGNASGPGFDAISIQIHNRHLACMKVAETAFIPVSHVWDQSVADSHISRTSTLAAAECLFNVITQMLPTVTTKFKHLYNRVELWHDYFSIPQWESGFQQSLLLMLPDIFGIAPLCLVHLRDVSAHAIVAAAQLDDTISGASQYATLAAIFRTEWFERMWTSLEYAHCNQPCAYTMDNVIMHDDQDRMCDSFSYLLEGFQQLMRRTVTNIGEGRLTDWFSHLPLTILGPLADMRRNVKHSHLKLTFGEALSFIAGRKCTDYRDRFIAMCGFLNIGHFAEIVLHIPKEPAQACLWVARRCLERGDYSPLLLIQAGEFEVQCARWLTGHQSMSMHMWDLGATVTPPDRLDIAFSGNRIYLPLDRVGSLKALYRPYFRNSNPLYVFDWIVSVLLSHLSHVDVAAFLSALERIYALPEFLRSSETPVKLSEYLKVVPNFSQKLESLLGLYLTYRLDEKARLNICTKLLVLLRFSAPLPGTLSEISRLTYAANPLETSSCYDDLVGLVRCRGCARTFL